MVLEDTAKCYDYLKEYIYCIHMFDGILIVCLIFSACMIGAKFLILIAGELNRIIYKQCKKKENTIILIIFFTIFTVFSLLMLANAELDTCEKHIMSLIVKDVING